MTSDINNEVAKASVIMALYRMSREHQMEVVRILLAAGVDHCLQEQEKIKSRNEQLIQRATEGAMH